MLCQVVCQVEATAFVQEPEVFDEPEIKSGDIVGMVIQSDFARCEADTKASEVSS